MANSLIASVPKLMGRENYSEWSFAAENFLILDGLKECIEGKELDNTKISQARAKLILTIDTKLYIHVKDTSTAEELWMKLKEMFDDNGFARKISLLRLLISTRLEDCDSMAAYINQIVDTAQRLRGTGFKVDDIWIGSLLLAGLPEKYSPMIMAIEHSGISITADSIKTKLLDMLDVDKAGSAFIGKFGKKKNWGKKVGNTAKTDTCQSEVSTSKVNKLKNVRCYKCNEMGHYKNKCPNASSKTAFSAIFLNGNQFNTDQWYVDSGASVHLTANKHWLRNVRQNRDKDSIITADKTEVTVECAGSLDITTIVGNNTFEIEVKDILYVPQLATNLLSVSQLIKNGNRVIFMTDCCKIYNSYEQLVGVAELVDNVYKLKTEQVKLLVAPAVSGEMWHRRLSHINQKDLLTMKNGAVDGMLCKGDMKLEKCVACCEGKQARSPFPNQGSRASGILELIHADICGPMEVQSIGKAKYFLILKDDFSKMCFVYFLKTKDESFEKFQQFKSLVENQTEKKIKILRSDNGKEFCSNYFENFLKKCGILHQTSTPYTPEQNGSAERMIRVVVEKARCLLADANLGKKFWAEAVNTAVYVRNRTVATDLGGKTPLEIWTRKKPDISHLRVFGSKVMVHIPKQKRLKWDRKSQEMYLVGYSDTAKAYRLYDPAIQEVVIRRDITVFEEEKEVKIALTEPYQQEEIHIHPTEVPAEEDIISVGETTEVNDTSSEQQEEQLDSSQTSSSSKRDSSGDEYIPEGDYVDSRVGVRRTPREPKPKRFDDHFLYMCGLNTEAEDENPTTVEEAMSRRDANMWRKAMSEEILAFNENDAWEIVDKPSGATIVDNKWVFKKKYDVNGELKYCARLVYKCTKKHYHLLKRLGIVQK